MESHLRLKNRLREYRREKGLTQQELAEMSGASRNTIVAIENGRFCPSAYLAMRFCEVFKCKFEDIFYFENQLNEKIDVANIEVVNIYRKERANERP